MKRIFIFSTVALLFAAVGYLVRVTHVVIDRSTPSFQPFISKAVDFCMTPFRMDYGGAGKIIDRFLLAAFQLISLLKPDYEDSIDTAGQNFKRDHRLRFAC